MSELPAEYNAGPRAFGPHDPQAAFSAFSGRGEFESEQAKAPGLERYLAAVLRFKWLILLVTFVGAALGVLLARMVPFQYEAAATVWIEARPRQGTSDAQPIRTAELLTSYAWVELVTSYSVLDPVVRQQRLYLSTGSPEAARATANLTVEEEYTPGRYRLTMDPDGRSFTLSTRDEVVVQKGTLGDSIGRSVGLLWAPPAGSLRPEQVIDFSVVGIRSAAKTLSEKLVPSVDREVNFLTLSLTGADPEKTATVVNAITDQYVQVAAELKRAKLTQLSAILQDQLNVSAGNLNQAEAALQDFKVNTITLPSDRGAPVSAGLQMTQDPVFDNYFSMKIQQEQLQRDRETINRVLADARNGPLSVFALEAVPSLAQSPSLQASLAELNVQRASLRALQDRYTDQYGQVADAQAAIDKLERETIPQQAAALVSALESRERELGSLIGSASTELQRIPERTIEEGRLQRRADIAEAMYTDLQSRTEEARLAMVSTIPDVRPLDRATAPQWPTNGDLPIRVMLMAFVGSFGMAVVGALLLDRFDPKVRYPDQVTTGMGLPILGAVPFVRALDRGSTPEEANHAIEAFREIRMNALYSLAANGPLAFAISSAEAGDGKSFVSSNLALAFAQQGHRTLLIDGDIRRGRLHHFLKGTRMPGLSDLLAGRASLSDVVQTTEVPSVSLIGSGTRMHVGPELLGSAAMASHLRDLQRNFDVILVDTPPLGAGVDPYVLATLTGNLLMVVRTGNTNRAFAEAKLKLLDRLPVRILGAVLNGVPANQRMYRYYSYLPNYGAEEEASRESNGNLLASIGG